MKMTKGLFFAIVFLLSGQYCNGAAAADSIQQPELEQAGVSILCSDGQVVVVPITVLEKFQTLTGLADMYKGTLADWIINEGGAIRLDVTSSRGLSLLSTFIDQENKLTAAVKDQLGTFSLSDFADFLEVVRFVDPTNDVREPLEELLIAQFLKDAKERIDAALFAGKASKEHQDALRLFDRLDKTVYFGKALPLFKTVFAALKPHPTFTYPVPARSTPDGSLYAVVSDEKLPGGKTGGVVTVFKAETQEEVIAVHHENYFGRSRSYYSDYPEAVFGTPELCFSADGRYMATATIVDGVIKVTDLVNRRTVMTYLLYDDDQVVPGSSFQTITAMALNSDGSLLIVGFKEGGVRVIAVPTSEVRYQVENSGLVKHVAFNDNSTKIIVLSKYPRGLNATLEVVDVAIGTIEYEYTNTTFYNIPAYATFIRIPSGENRLLQFLDSGTVDSIEIDQQQPEQQYFGLYYPFAYVPSQDLLVARDFDIKEAMPNGKRLAIIERESGVRLGEISTPGYIADVVLDGATKKLLLKTASDHKDASVKKHTELFEIILDSKILTHLQSYLFPPYFLKEQERKKQARQLLSKGKRPDEVDSKPVVLRELELEQLAEIPKIMRDQIVLSKEQREEVDALVLLHQQEEEDRLRGKERKKNPVDEPEAAVDQSGPQGTKKKGKTKWKAFQV